MEATQPLISCLCVTRHRVAFLKRAISCFKNQTYKRKELVIVFEDDDRESMDYLAKVKRKDISVIKIKRSAKLHLGQLRNLAVQRARGLYCCQWDDDDWYHPERLEKQLSAIQDHRKQASVLQYWLMYDSIDKQAFMSYPGPWAGSLMFRKSLWAKLRYPNTRKGEDSSSFLIALYKQKQVVPVVLPWLYVYTFNGSNTWSKRHFQSLFQRCQKLSTKSSDLIRTVLDDGTLTDGNVSQLEVRLSPELDYYSHRS